jgi:hypothetical protein
MTEKQWDANPDFRKELAEILRRPVMIAALEILYRQGRKAQFPAPGVSFDITQYGAFIGFKREGYNEALQNLGDLAQTPIIVEKAGPRPWETTDEPAAPAKT